MMHTFHFDDEEMELVLDALDDSKHPFCFCDGSYKPDAVWMLNLNKYQRDNLMALLETMGVNHKPHMALYGLNSGDWAQELYFMLKENGEDVPTSPNMTADQQHDAVDKNIGQMVGDINA